MPTIVRWRGYRFFFYSHEPNEPPHVHVGKGGAQAKFWLAPVSPARNVGFGETELNLLRRKVEEEQAAFMEAWDGYFGTTGR